MLSHLLVASLILTATAGAPVTQSENAPAGATAPPSAPSSVSAPANAPAPPSGGAQATAPATAPATGTATGSAKAPTGGATKSPANGPAKSQARAPVKATAKGRNAAATASAHTSAGASPHAASEIAVGRFSASDLSGWTEKSHKGQTTYTLEDGYLKAHAVKAGSGRIKKVSVDVHKFPLLSWSWRIDHTLKREDIKVKSGDDFAARIYVIFPRTFFWRMRAINYVWAAKMPKGSEAPSPYTKNSEIIAVESGDEKAGKLVFEERNIYEDYKRIFGEEPPLLGGVAILTDTDDTQDEATAWYGDISLRAP